MSGDQFHACDFPAHLTFYSSRTKSKKMGRGKKWGIEERQKLALGWCRVSMDPVVGRNQTGTTFIAKLYEALRQSAPTSFESGTFGERKPETIISFWKNAIAPDVQKFNNALKKVHSCHPTGVDDQQIVNMAVAIHLGKTDRMMYAMKSFNPMEWLNYLAWQVVRNIPKFKYPGDNNQKNEKSALPDVTDTVIADGSSISDNKNSGNSSVSVGSDLDSLTENEPDVKPTSLVVAGIGRDKSKTAMKRKSDHAEVINVMSKKMGDMNDEHVLMRKTMQWKLYYKMCNNEKDTDGMKKAKMALEELLDVKPSLV